MDNFSQQHLLKEIQSIRQEVKDLKEGNKSNSLQIKKSIDNLGARLIALLRGPYNWNDLPPEMKVECVKELGVTDRYRLHSTSTTERALVESQKMNFEKLEINVTTWQSMIFIRGIDRFWRSRSSEDVHLLPYGIIEFLLKIGIIDEFSMDFSTKISFGMRHPKFPGPFEIQSEDVHADTLFCLEKIKNPVKKIKLDAYGASNYPIDQILMIPCIIGTPFWQIVHLLQSDVVYKVARMYIDRNVDVGTIFQCSVSDSNSMEKFGKKFKHRIVIRTDRIIRITTLSSRRHILLELNPETTNVDGWSVTQYFRLQVIAAKMTESEYDTDQETWKSQLENYDQDENEDDSDAEWLDSDDTEHSFLVESGCENDWLCNSDDSF